MRNTGLFFIVFLFLVSFHGVLADSNEESSLIIHDFPRLVPKSNQFTVEINGQVAPVYHTTYGSFVSFECDQTVKIKVISQSHLNGVNLFPKSAKVASSVKEKVLTFSLPSNTKLLMEAEGMEQLFFYGHSVQKDKPDPNAENVTFFKAGQIYEVGELTPKTGETVYIEGGAVVRGNIKVTKADNVTIAGLGVLDGGYYLDAQKRPKTILVEGGENINISGVTMIEPQAWTLMLYMTENILIDGIKQITGGHGSDGIDVVSSRNVKIEDSFLRNGDDCIVIKAFDRPQYTKIEKDWTGTHNVTATNCILQSNGGGQAFEIGHELTEGNVSNINFIDCDVVGLHGQGGVFGIHNSDAAMVENVLYQDIRVDHFYNKLIDLRIIKSRWSKDEEPGKVKNVLFKNTTRKTGFLCS